MDLKKYIEENAHKTRDFRNRTEPWQIVSVSTANPLKPEELPNSQNQKEILESTIQVLKDEITVLREEKKTLLSLVERLTLK